MYEIKKATFEFKGTKNENEISEMLYLAEERIKNNHGYETVKSFSTLEEAKTYLSSLNGELKRKGDILRNKNILNSKNPTWLWELSIPYIQDIQSGECLFAKTVYTEYFIISENIEFGYEPHHTEFAELCKEFIENNTLEENSRNFNYIKTFATEEEAKAELKKSSITVTNVTYNQSRKEKETEVCAEYMVIAKTDITTSEVEYERSFPHFVFDYEKIKNQLEDMDANEIYEYYVEIAEITAPSYIENGKRNSADNFFFEKQKEICEINDDWDDEKGRLYTVPNSVLRNDLEGDKLSEYRNYMYDEFDEIINYPF